MNSKAIFRMVRWTTREGIYEEASNEVNDRLIYPIRYFIYATGFFCLYNIWVPLIGIFIAAPIAIIASLLICDDIRDNTVPAETADTVIPAVIINVIRIFQASFHASWMLGILGIFGGMA